MEEERYVSISECSGEHATWIIKLSKVHRYNEKNHTKLKSYKFDSPTGEVLIGTINKIAGEFLKPNIYMK